MTELPTILVIEDEDVIQLLVEDALTEGGFVVEIVASGEEALQLFGASGKEYKALVTDIGLKGEMTGWDVAAKARETNPALPVIYMSGACRGLGIQRRPQQHHARQAVRTCPARYRRRPTSQ